MKYWIRKLTAVLLFTVLFGQGLVQAQDNGEYEEVSIRDLNTYPENPQTISDIENHPLAYDEEEGGPLVQFDAVVVSNPRSSGMSNFDDEADDEDQISRIHFFVIDVDAVNDSKKGMYMHVVTNNNAFEGDEDNAVEAFETLQRGDVRTFYGYLTFFGGANTAQFTPTSSPDALGNIIIDDEHYGEEYLDLLEPLSANLSDITIPVEDGEGYTFNPETYSDYVNAYVNLEGMEVLARTLDDDYDGSVGSGRPDFYWVDDQGTPMTYRDISLRYRNDRNEEFGGYKDGYNFRRTEEGPFQPPRGGSIVDISGFLVTDTFDAYDLGESSDLNPLQLSPMEDGVVWWGTGDDVEKLTHDPNDEDIPWPDDLVTLGLPANLADYSISTTTPQQGEQVVVEADFDAEGEEVQSAEISYWSTDGTEETVEMSRVEDNSFEYEFSSFADFTSVEFELMATTEAELQDGTVTDITARFSHGDETAAGEELTMRFTQVAETLDKISYIQTTMDGDRGPSPLTDIDFEEAGIAIDIEGVVVADTSNGFVVIHDDNRQFSGLPLEASDLVADLQIGDRVNITGGSIANADWPPEYNTYLADLEVGDISVVEDNQNPGDYIPTVSVEDAVVNDGAAYEGMIIRLEDVEAATWNPDAPDNNYGEWAIRLSGDENGDELRIRNDLAFDAIIGDFETKIPFGFNAHIIEGVHFDHIYGFMSNSYGDPAKIHLRTLDDLHTEESFTYPVRNISLYSIDSADPEDESAGPDGAIVNVDNFAVFEESISYDGDEVSYRWVMNPAGETDFEDPLLESEEYDIVNDTVRVSVSASELEQAYLDAGYGDDESGEFIWTVFLEGGEGEEVQVADSQPDGFAPFYQEVTLGYADVVQSPHDPDTPQTVELNQNYPNPFNPVTNIEYQIPEQTEVRLTVYDVLGRQVAVLVNDEQTAGSYTVSFDGSALSSGMYIYRLEAGSVTRTQQMMLVK